MGLVQDTFAIQPPVTTTATGTSNGGVDLSAYRSAVFSFNCTAASGTTPSLQAKLQWTDDNGATWYDFDPTWYTGGVNWAACTGVSQQSKLTAVEPFGKIRVSYAITGTTPSFTWYMNCLAIK